MTHDDKRTFQAAWNRLRDTTKHERWTVEDETAKHLLYFESLADLPIDAVIGAEGWLRRYGDGWMPPTAVWAQKAREFAADVRDRQRRVEAAKLALPASTEERTDWLARADAARGRCVAECRQLGLRYFARFFAALPIRHPSESVIGQRMLVEQAEQDRQRLEARQPARAQVRDGR